MRRLSVFAPLALLAAATLVGCGTAAIGASPRTAGVSAAQTVIRPARPAAEAATPVEGDVQALGSWQGRIGTRRARLWVPYSGYLQAECDGVSFRGSILAGNVSGQLARVGRPTGQVSLTVAYGSAFTGWVNGRAVSATFGQGGWLSGVVGSRRVALWVLPDSINGTIGGEAVWMPGAWYQPGEEWGVAAAVLALAGGL